MRSALVRLAICCLLGPGGAFALGPHELLLLVNANSPRSIEIANHYAHLRGIPAANIVQLALPPSATSAAAYLTREQFTQAIWEPAQAALRDRRIGDHILAWVYSADFPVLITGEPQLSLTGLTFVRNQVPDPELIRKGVPVSRLFAGPGPDLKQRGIPRTLEQYAMALGTNLPLPSMMLAHTGARGESVDQALRRLHQAARLNGTPLSGSVFFLTSDDVRTTCRSWQFEDAAQELKALGQTARVLPLKEARRAAPAWGIMAGLSMLDPLTLPALVPGSVAEHLTSFGAVFNGHDYQTKLTAWLRAGAAGSAGTVTEPYAQWTKFPHARLFVHYASGCTLLESFAQAVAHPLQLVCVGDPLLAPWAKSPGLTLVSLAEDGPLRGTVEFAASTWAGPTDRDTQIMYLLDGRTVLPSGTPPLLRVPTPQLSDGYHEVRAVAYAAAPVRHQGFTTLGFTVANRERRLAVLDLASNTVLHLGQPRPLALSSDPLPRAWALVQHERVLDEQPAVTGMTYRLDPALLGPGPHRLQVAALYDDGEVVRSAPIPVLVKAMPASAAEERVVLSFSSKAVTGGSLTNVEGWLQLRGEPGTLVVPSETDVPDAREVSVTLKVPGGEQSLLIHQADLVFGYQNATNYSLLGWRGGTGSWMLGRMVDGAWHGRVEWGATLERDQSYQLRLVRQPEGGVRAEVDGRLIGIVPDQEWAGRFGLAAGPETMLFQSPSAAR